MPEWLTYSSAAIAWIGFAVLLGKYIRIKGKALKTQVELGFATLLLTYVIGLILLFIGLTSAN